MIKVAPCITCKHFDDTALHTQDVWKCAAFPDGIPEVILSGDNQHEDPVTGDHGIRYESVPVHRYEYEHPVMPLGQQAEEEAA